MVVDYSKCITKANPDDYYLQIYSDIPQDVRVGFIGYVSNTSNLKMKVNIEIDDKYMIESKMLSATFLMNTSHYENSCEIVLTSNYFSNIRDSMLLDCMIWHEIGHYHTNRYFPYVPDERGSLQYIRNEYAVRREIMPNEKVADLFAVYYTSKDDMIEFLNFAIKRRRANVLEDRYVNDKAVAELSRRRRFIRECDCSDENIRKMICELCGVDDFYSL